MRHGQLAKAVSFFYALCEGEVIGGGGADLSELAKVSALCNQAVIHYQDAKYERVGEPTEAALKVHYKTAQHHSTLGFGNVLARFSKGPPISAAIIAEGSALGGLVAILN